MQTAAEKLQVIDDAIEQFEQRWRPDGGDLIQQTAEAVGLSSDPQLLAELIRVDIDRRYAAGRDVDLQDYFRRFPNINREASHVAAICFEDFRVRRQRRKICPPGRWADFPAVESEAWFRELQAETQVTTASGHVEFPSTASFISSQLLPGEAAFAPAAVPHSTERIGDFELVALLGEVPSVVSTLPGKPRLDVAMWRLRLSTVRCRSRTICRACSIRELCHCIPVMKLRALGAVHALQRCHNARTLVERGQKPTTPHR